MALTLSGDAKTNFERFPSAREVKVDELANALDGAAVVVDDSKDRRRTADALRPASLVSLLLGLGVSAALGLTPLGARLMRAVGERVGGRWFVQALEGDESVVQGLYERISEDPRHEDVTVIESSPREGIRRSAISSSPTP